MIIGKNSNVKARGFVMKLKLCDRPAIINKWCLVGTAIFPSIKVDGKPHYFLVVDIWKIVTSFSHQIGK